MMIGGRHRPEKTRGLNAIPSCRNYVTLIISSSGREETKWPYVQSQRQLTIEVDILSEQDALFRLSLFHLKNNVFEGHVET